MRTARVYVWNAIKMAAVSEITLMLLLCSLMRNKSPQKTNISSFDRMKRSCKKRLLRYRRMVETRRRIRSGMFVKAALVIMAAAGTAAEEPGVDAVESISPTR